MLGVRWRAVFEIAKKTLGHKSNANGVTAVIIANGVLRDLRSA
jgi:hypothetical protein